MNAIEIIQVTNIKVEIYINICLCNKPCISSGLQNSPLSRKFPKKTWKSSYIKIEQKELMECFHSRPAKPLMF